MEKRPIELSDLMPNWHIERCWKADALQAWWKATPSGKPLTSNIQPGDWFTFGTNYVYRVDDLEKRRPQLSLVTEKTYIGAIAPAQPTYQYHIGHQVGGHFFVQKHSTFVANFSLWIPTAQQLWILGQYDWALALLQWAEAIEGPIAATIRREPGDEYRGRIEIVSGPGRRRHHCLKVFGEDAAGTPAKCFGTGNCQCPCEECEAAKRVESVHRAITPEYLPVRMYTLKLEGPDAGRVFVDESLNKPEEPK